MQLTGLIALWQVVPGLDGFESLWIVGTLEECLALRAHSACQNVEAGSVFELRAA